VEARRDDGGIVTKQRVTGAQILGQIPELAMLDPVLGPVDHEQPRFIAPGGRPLGNKGFRQRIVKGVGLQAGRVRERQRSGSNEKGAHVINK
jgi:hypothetical protein